MAKLDLIDLEEKSIRRVWVVNKTRGENRSRVIFSVPKTRGQGQDLIEVPNTWLPVDLTQQITKRQLMESSDFRTALNAGLLVLIDEKEAQEALQDEDAAEELARLKALKTRSKDRNVKPNTAPNVQQPTPMVNQQKADMPPPEAMPSPGVQALALQMKEQDYNDTQLTNTLKNMELARIADVRFLRDRTINFPKAQKLLAKVEKRLLEEA